MSVEQKLNKSGTHKLLSIDGGGIRSLISLEVLAEVERLLQQAEGRGDSVMTMIAGDT